MDAPESAREIVSTRLLPYARPEVFRAIADPERLARWWGPAGFSNSFERFDFREGGDWKFVMHGPDGTDYPNHSVFEAIDAPERVVLRHVVAPRFRMTMSLTEEPQGTRLQWRMLFEDARLRDELAPVCVPANEQNFDRLQAELASHR